MRDLGAPDFRVPDLGTEVNDRPFLPTRSEEWNTGPGESGLMAIANSSGEVTISTTENTLSNGRLKNGANSDSRPLSNKMAGDSPR